MSDSDEQNRAIREYELASIAQIDADEVLRSDDESTRNASGEYNSRHEDAVNRREEADADRLEGENRLRDRIGDSALKFVWVQLIVSDAIVIIYVVTMLCMGREIPEGIIVGWMTATVVEVIGILWVIARSLFPFRDEYRDRKSEQDGPQRGR